MFVSVIKTSIKGVVVLFAIFLLMVIVKMTLFNDVTTSPAYNYVNKKKTPIYLVSYADGDHVFYKNQNALSLSALNRGFDFILNYRRDLLSEDFVSENKEILDSKQGVGFWLWKPWVILDAMNRAPKDAIIVYSDVGFIFTGSIDDMLDTIENKDGLLIEYDEVDIYGTVDEAVNRQTLIRNNCDNMACRKSPHVMGGFIIVKNNENSKRFITGWFELCKNKNNIMGVSEVNMEQYPEFVNHRHDEGLLSMTYFLEENNMHLFPVTEAKKLYWAHRKKESQGFKTLYPLINKPKHWGFDKGFLNSSLFVWLRENFSAYQ